MKKTLLMCILTLCLAGCGEKKDFNESKQLICLDNYRIPTDREGVKIAQILNTDSVTVTLSKDTSGIFEIDHLGILALKKGVWVDATSPMRYEIEVDCQGYKKTFELVKDDFIRNKVIAHRGAWKHHGVSQNSLGSLRAGIELGCEAIEFDVWYTADNELILSHDPIIGEKRIEDTPANEILQIELMNGETVPHLKQYIDIIKTQNKSHLVLEIKVSEKGKDRNMELAEAVVRTIHREKIQAWVEYISFSYDILLKIRELDSTARLSYLENNKPVKEIKTSGLSGIDYYYSTFFQDSLLVTHAHQLGITTNAWTVNKREDMERLLEMGIDYLTTDEPEIALEVVGKTK